MLNEKMRDLGARRSVIRELFEYGKKRKAEIGEENVFDFSIGNPSVPSPAIVNDTLAALLRDKDPVSLHGYTSAQGDAGVRRAIADYIKKTHGAVADPDLIYLTVGAAASLTVSLTAVLNPGDEVILLAPFFPEYRVFVERTGAVAVPVLCDTKSFQPDLSAIRAAISEKTRAIIVNSPNNPTGVVMTRESIEGLAALLKEASDTYGAPIYLLADEPYRELVYGDVSVPYLPDFYANTLVCYSFSKSLSLPGERIGYIFVSPKVNNCGDVYAAVCGAGRALGFVCAPSLLQFTVAETLGTTSDISIYEKNRNLLYDNLTKYGYKVVSPDGAFYLFVKSPEEDANAFCEKAKSQEILIVPGDDFGYPGYVRISYCVSTAMIEKSLPGFEKLIEEYR